MITYIQSPPIVIETSQGDKERRLIESEMLSVSGDTSVLTPRYTVKVSIVARVVNSGHIDTL